MAGKLADKWRTGKIQVDQAPPIVLESVPDMEVEGPDADSDSQEHPDPPAAKVPRRSKYVIVELPGAIFRLHRSGANGCWMGRRREFRNSQEFPDLPDKSEYTHVCRLCWPSGGEGVKSSAADSEHTPHPFYSHLSQSSCVKRRLGHSSSATYGLHSPITMLQTQTLRALARTP